MINVVHKLYPTKKQESFLGDCLWSSIAIENWAINQIKYEFDWFFPLRWMKPIRLRSFLSGEIKGHAKRSNIPSKLLNDCIGAVLDTYGKLKKKFGPCGVFRMHLKNVRKKKSFYFSGDIKLDEKGRIKIPGLKTTLRISEANKFHGKLKKATFIKKWNGWYVCCTYDEQRKPIEVIDSKEAGIDPGLKTALTFSDGRKEEFPRFYQETEEQLSKAQRKSKNSKRVKVLHEKAKNKRKDHHHKLSTELARTYRIIYWSNDSFKGLIRLFGKSYSNLGLGKFRDYLKAKLSARNGGFGELIGVSNKYSTQTCSACGTLTGPKGKSGLGVREWTCRCCGAMHDRDVNAAINTLFSGQGMSSDLGNHINHSSCLSCA